MGGPQVARNLKFRKQVRAGYRDFRVTHVCVIIRAGTIEQDHPRKSRVVEKKHA